jgi:dipeptidyl-peptidase-3
MKRQLTMLAMATVLCVSCNNGKQAETEAKFDYANETFADIQMLRYEVKGFESLTLDQKKLVYYLQEAALQGRDILFDQNGRHNLVIRKMLETVYTDFQGDKTTDDWNNFVTYTKRVWFSNGIHHHYSADKFAPGFSPEFFREALASVDAAKLPLAEGQTLAELCEEVFPAIFDPAVMPKRVNQADGEDLVLTSASNYYDGVTQVEAEAFYNNLKDPKDETPVMYGMNSRLV